MAQRFQPLFEMTYWDIGAGDVAGRGDARKASLTGKGVAKPIRLAGLVVEHLGKTETLEPPRGPRAQVSQEIPAVDDNGPVRVQVTRSMLIQVV